MEGESTQEGEGRRRWEGGHCRRGGGGQKTGGESAQEESDSFPPPCCSPYPDDLLSPPLPPHLHDLAQLAVIHHDLLDRPLPLVANQLADLSRVILCRGWDPQTGSSGPGRPSLGTHRSLLIDPQRPRVPYLPPPHSHQSI